MDFKAGYQGLKNISRKLEDEAGKSPHGPREGLRLSVLARVQQLIPAYLLFVQIPTQERNIRLICHLPYCSVGPTRPCLVQKRKSQ